VHYVLVHSFEKYRILEYRVFIFFTDLHSTFILKDKYCLIDRLMFGHKILCKKQKEGKPNRIYKL
jgi:hypothetical protein